MFEKLKQDRLVALKSADKTALSFLSVLIGDVELELKRKQSKSADELALEKIKKAVITLQENYKLSPQDKFKEEISFWQKYLPPQMSSEELAETIRVLLQSVENPTVGTLMKLLKQSYDGTYDSKNAAEIIKSMLE